jgi:lipid-binding SYLF domain-containing protein
MKNRFLMKDRFYAVLLGAALALATAAWLSPAPANADEKEKDINRIRESGTVLQEILDMPDSIPADLMNKARCVIVFPSVVKAAFVVGGSFGHGVMVCRTHKDYTGAWGAPAMMSLEQGSVGFQIGGQATDFVILVMNNRGADSLLHNKVKLGADASVAAGPKGRDAAADTDAAFRAEMLTYSRARGVFAGVSLEGGTIHADNDADRRIYGNDASAELIITESRFEAPPEAHALIARLHKASPALHS